MTETLPTLHMIGLFHTIPDSAHSHCAFTGKVLRFAKMMRMYGWNVIEYSNGESESLATEHVQLLTEAELGHLNRCFYAVKSAKEGVIEGIVNQYKESKSKPAKKALQEAYDMAIESYNKGEWVKEAVELSNEEGYVPDEVPVHVDHGYFGYKGSPAHVLFTQRLIKEAQSRIKAGDIVLHPFCDVAADLASNLGVPVIHVESGVGYNNAPLMVPNKPGADGKMTYKRAYRIYETHTHQSHCFSQYGVDPHYSYVVPNYYDLEDWAVNLDPEVAKSGPLLFFGRLVESKGLAELWEIAKAAPSEKFIAVGQCAVPKHYLDCKPDNIELRGPLTGRARSDLLGSCAALLMPSTFNEPFGGAGVEGMLCGTPLLAHDVCAFHTTVQQGVTGYRCHTVGDWVEAIRRVRSNPDLRRTTAGVSRRRFSLEACGKKYDNIFRQLTYAWDDATRHNLAEDS